ncbi:MAG: sulfite exporter TauE/SafE family protein [Bacteroidales bacterium]|nr:sulfite exporter TauE/SafE family protein [Bacteroidales bacterium]
MTEEIRLLTFTAASIGLFHTLFGPDHYLPFIVMSKAGKWSLNKTIWITIASGVGHVLSSVALGFVGIALGIGVNRLTGVEAGRGNLAAWMLIAFGFAYMIWGIRRVIRNKRHDHIHVHEDGTYHTHKHSHQSEHSHVHNKGKSQNLTPWILFTIFVLGPCEPLIPILMYPAAENNISGLIMVTSVFAIVTIVTMLVVVIVGYYGFSFVQLGKLEKYTHALAGVTIMLSGLAIMFLGL